MTSNTSYCFLCNEDGNHNVTSKFRDIFLYYGSVQSLNKFCQQHLSRPTAMDKNTIIWKYNLDFWLKHRPLFYFPTCCRTSVEGSESDSVIPNVTVIFSAVQIDHWIFFNVLMLHVSNTNNMFSHAFHYITCLIISWWNILIMTKQTISW